MTDNKQLILSHVRELQRRGEKGDTFAIKTLACMVLLLEPAYEPVAIVAAGVMKARA